MEDVLHTISEVAKYERKDLRDPANIKDLKGVG